MGNSVLIRLSICEMLLGVNSGTIPTYCMSFQGPQMLGFVHYVSISKEPNLVKAARCNLLNSVIIFRLPMI